MLSRHEHNFSVYHCLSCVTKKVQKKVQKSLGVPCCILAEVTALHQFNKISKKALNTLVGIGCFLIVLKSFYAKIIIREFYI